MSATDLVLARPPRAPKTDEQATACLDQIARLDAERVHVNAMRDRAIADSNAVADALLVPITARRAALVAVIEPWWAANGARLLPKGRKTMELGGCVIGTKVAPVALTFACGDDQLAAKTLHESRWSKGYAKVTMSVDKAAVKRALGGAHGDRLRALGFGTSGGADALVLEAVKQAGTVG